MISIQLDQKHQSCCQIKLQRPLQSLKPVVVLPERFSARMGLLTTLKRIESIQITHCVEREGKLYYGIAVYMRQFQSRIPTSSPTSQSTSASLCSRKPDFQTERRFNEFRKLRSRIHKHAYDSGFCSFCDDLLKYFYYSECQPRLFTPFYAHEERMKQILTTFLNELLALTVRSKATSYRMCEGQERIPNRLAVFLQIQSDA